MIKTGMFLKIAGGRRGGHKLFVIYLGGGGGELEK